MSKGCAEVSFQLTILYRKKEQEKCHWLISDKKWQLERNFHKIWEFFLFLENEKVGNNSTEKTRNGSNCPMRG